MSEIIENTSEEVVDIVPVENEVTTNDTEEQVKEEYKPWKEKKVPETIPYNRFSEVNAQKKAAEERAQELERELAQYKETKDNIKKYKTPKDVKIDEFEDLDKFFETRDEIVINNTIERYKQELEIENEKKRTQEIQDKILNELSSKLQKAVEKNPEIKHAVEYIDKFAAYLPPETRYALVTEDNPGEVMYEIATTPGLLEQLMKMHYVDAGRKIAKMSAKYDNIQEEKVIDIPKVMPMKTGTPNIKSNVSSGKIQYRDDMSVKEYKAWAKQQGIKL